MTTSLRDVLVGLPVYVPIRFVYQSLFNRDAILRRKARRQFYSSFLQPGDLVFDVGANLGNYAEALCAVGATVVAIEPDPRNVKILKRRLQSAHAHIEPCALGRSEGSAELRIASDRVDLSTLSKRWAENQKADWQGTVRVPVRTLDSIAKEYGVPKYVKVDAEGYDAEVLRAMSFRPEIFSFEFLPDDMDIARECIQLFPECAFNFVIEQRSRFELNRWASGEEILTALLDLPKTVLYGDVFAKNLSGPVVAGSIRKPGN
jgi:FkbM family methyltransferase